MLQLVISLIAIALMGVTVTATVMSVNPVPIIAAREAGRLDDGFTALQSGYLTYTDTTHTQPGSLGDLAPAYVFLPPAPTGTTWSYGVVSGDTRYFCLSGTFTVAQLQALDMLRRDFSPQAYFVSSVCGGASAPTGSQAAAYLLVRPNAGAVP